MFSSFDLSTRWKLLLWAQPTLTKRENRLLIATNTLTFCSSYLTIYIYIYVCVCVCVNRNYCTRQFVTYAHTPDKRSWLFGDDSVKVKSHKIDPVVYSKMAAFSRCERSVSRPSCLTPGKEPPVPNKKDWVGIKVGLDALEKETIPCACRESSYWLPVVVSLA